MFFHFLRVEREVFGSLMEQLMINTGESELEVKTSLSKVNYLTECFSVFPC